MLDSSKWSQIESELKRIKLGMIVYPKGALKWQGKVYQIMGTADGMVTVWFGHMQRNSLDLVVLEGFQCI